MTMEELKRNLTETLATSRADAGAPFGFARLVTDFIKDPRVLALWRFRARSRAELKRLSDRELEDIGLSRREALQEASKPFWKA